MREPEDERLEGVRVGEEGGQGRSRSEWPAGRLRLYCGIYTNSAGNNDDSGWYLWGRGLSKAWTGDLAMTAGLASPTP